jgi:hypothetical protein
MKLHKNLKPLQSSNSQVMLSYGDFLFTISDLVSHSRASEFKNLPGNRPSCWGYFVAFLSPSVPLRSSTRSRPFPQHKATFITYTNLTLFQNYSKPMKNAIFWHVTSCGSCKNRRFGGTYRLHNKGDKHRRARSNISSE